LRLTSVVVALQARTNGSFKQIPHGLHPLPRSLAPPVMLGIQGRVNVTIAR
jgi:hypothetical protein